jgi:hypothetical protein
MLGSEPVPVQGFHPEATTEPWPPALPSSATLPCDRQFAAAMSAMWSMRCSPYSVMSSASSTKSVAAATAA